MFLVKWLRGLFLPGRLMVGRKTLDLAIMVRIHAGQHCMSGEFIRGCFGEMVSSTQVLEFGTGH